MGKLWNKVRRYEKRKTIWKVILTCFPIGIAARENENIFCNFGYKDN